MAIVRRDGFKWCKWWDRLYQKHQKEDTDERESTKKEKGRRGRERDTTPGRRRRAEVEESMSISGVFLNTSTFSKMVPLILDFNNCIILSTETYVLYRLREPPDT